MNYKVEKEWITKSGLKAVVLLVHPSMPHRCGYVGIPKEHKFYGIDYSNIESDIYVHGGLTYSNNDEAYPIKSDLWWLGFDAAHAGDTNDWEAGKILIETKKEQEQVDSIKSVIGRYPTPGDIIKTLDYMVKECEDLANQLKENK